MNPKIKDAIDKLNKAFGTGAVVTFNKDSVQKIERFPSGSIGLDIALGGGYPKGRIIEIYGTQSGGKTTLTLHAIAEIHKMGGTAAFIDAEHAFDPTYAKSIGVEVENEEKFIFSQPMSGEEAVEVARELLKTGEVDLIVIDSVAAMIPKAELLGEVGDSKMGLHARLMSQAMRMLTGEINKTSTTVIFINQIREKIGVMFGCLHYETRVLFTDGRSLPIGEVVNNKIEGEVWSINEATGKFESKQITGWHKNGKVQTNEHFIHLQTKSINGFGRFGLTVTPNHKILTSNGWKEGKELNIGDKLVSKYDSIVNGTLSDFLYGCFVGDSYLAIRGNNANLKLQDSSNKEYLKWKVGKLSPFFKFRANGKKMESNYSYELLKIKESLGKRNPLEFFKNYSDLGLALWYMDDGYYDTQRELIRYRISISVGRFKRNKDILEKIKECFEKQLNIKVKAVYKNGNFCFEKEASDEIFKRIKKYVPDCMQYKLHPNYRGFYEDFTLSNKNEIKQEFVEVVLKRFASNRQMRTKDKFDISVKDNHNYLVGGCKNGVIVHNSPETTSGGNALKFFASIRLDVRSAGQNKDGDEVVSNKTRVKVIKNKTAPPFRQCEFDIVFGHGIDSISEMIDFAVDLAIIKKAGSWYSYGETKIGQGIEKVKDMLNDNPELFEEIVTKLQNKLNE
jgi:recombination protein RecA